MPYTAPFLFYGNQFAVTSSQPHNIGNKSDPNFEMKIENASAIGGQNDLFRIVWTQNINSTDEVFKNGQHWAVQRYDASGDADHDPSTGTAGWSTIHEHLVPKPDLVQGLGTGNDYIVFEAGGKHFLLDINANFSATPTTLRYPGSGTNGFLSFDEMRSSYKPHGAPPVCFAAGTLIETPQGPRRIETLAVGDLVLTRDHGPQPLRWIGRRELSACALAADARLRPIRIAANSIRPGVPSSDLVVSQQHRILVRSDIATRMFGTREILVAAKQLLALPGIEIVEDNAGVTYFHLLFNQHEVVISNNTETESLYPGPVALQSVGQAARDEIAAIFPEFLAPDFIPSAARHLVPGRLARTLVDRHIRNARGLI